MIKKILIKLLLIFIIFFIPLSSCRSEESVNTAVKTFFAMDTVMNVKLYGDRSQKDLENMLEEIKSEIERQDRVFSKFYEDSQLYKINHRSLQEIEITEEMYEILSEAHMYSEMSKGAFDYTLGALTELWNIRDNAKDSITVLPEVDAIEEKLTHTGYDNVTLKTENGKFILKILDDELVIDLGGIAKGYAADKIVEICQDKNVSAIISIGGSIAAVGEKPDGSEFIVGIRDPDGNSGDYIGTINLKNGESTSTSGSYERFFEAEGKKYCHIIDGKTGYPVDNNIVSVTVIGEKGIVCDALSTACFVLGREEGSKLLDNMGYKYIWIDKNRNVFCSEDVNLEEKSE